MVDIVVFAVYVGWTMFVLLEFVVDCTECVAVDIVVGVVVGIVAVIDGEQCFSFIIILNGLLI